MKMTRRAFSALLCAAGASLGSLGSPRVAANEPGINRQDRATDQQDLVGYPLRLVRGRPASGWSVSPGQTVYFALSSESAKTITLAMHSATGSIVHSFGRVAIETQGFVGGSPWSHGAGFRPTISWTIPAHTPSGVYFLSELPNIFVVVRDLSDTRAPHAPNGIPTAVLIPTNTISAYSPTNRLDFYSSPTRVPILSFLRPFDASEKANWLGLLKFIAKERIFGSPRYLTDHCLESRDALANVKLLIIDGHSEYWSRKAREKLDQFIAAGGHVIVAGGNALWWQVRYAAQGDQLVCYKDKRLDPVRDPMLVTVEWIKPGLVYPPAVTIGGDFRHGGYGRLSKGADVSSAGLRVVDGQHPLLRGLGLKACEILDLGGVSEMDGAPIVGFDVLGRPVPDVAGLGAYRLEILAWDWGKRAGQTTVGTAHVYQRRELSGAVLHLGAMNCCEGTSSGHRFMRLMCRNFAQRIYHQQSLFSGLSPVAAHLAMHTPRSGQPPALHGECG